LVHCLIYPTNILRSTLVHC